MITRTPKPSLLRSAFEAAALPCKLSAESRPSGSCRVTGRDSVARGIHQRIQKHSLMTRAAANGSQSHRRHPQAFPYESSPWPAFKTSDLDKRTEAISELWNRESCKTYRGRTKLAMDSNKREVFREDREICLFRCKLHGQLTIPVMCSQKSNFGGQESSHC